MFTKGFFLQIGTHVPRCDMTREKLRQRSLRPFCVSAYNLPYKNLPFYFFSALNVGVIKSLPKTLAAAKYKKTSTQHFLNHKKMRLGMGIRRVREKRRMF